MQSLKAPLRIKEFHGSGDPDGNLLLFAGPAAPMPYQGGLTSLSLLRCLDAGLLKPARFAPRGGSWLAASAAANCQGCTQTMTANPRVRAQVRAAMPTPRCHGAIALVT